MDTLKQWTLYNHLISVCQLARPQAAESAVNYASLHHHVPIIHSSTMQLRTPFYPNTVIIIRRSTIFLLDGAITIWSGWGGEMRVLLLQRSQRYTFIPLYFFG